MNLRRLQAISVFLSILVAALVAPLQAKPYKSVEMITNEQFKYGAFEARIRGAQGSGEIMAFFLYKYGSENSGAEWEEQDFELFGKDGTLQSQLMMPGSPRTEHVVLHSLPTAVWDRYYTYRMEWTPSAVSFYIDGALVRRETDVATYWKLLDSTRTEPMALRISLWAGDWSWSGLLDTTKVPAHIDVNWAQVYNYTPGKGPGGTDFTLRWKDDFNSIDNNRWYFANWTFDYAVNDYSTGNRRTKNGYYQAFLTRWENEGKSFTDPLVDDGKLMPPPAYVPPQAPKFPADPVTLPARIDANAPSAIYNQTAGNKGDALCSGTDLDAQMSDDTIGGKCNIGWTTAGDWEEYTIVSTSTTTYDVFLRAASGDPAGARFDLLLDGASVAGPLTVPGAEGKWQGFQNIPVQGVVVPVGTHKIRVVHLTSGLNLKNIEFKAAPSSLVPETNIVYAPIVLPAVILGQQYSADFDSTSDNQGGGCRFGDVDLETTTDLFGTCDIGYTKAQEWVEYKVHAQTDATFQLALRLTAADPGKLVQVSVDGVDLGQAIEAPANGWQGFATVDLPTPIHLTSGLHTVRVTFLTGDANLHWISILPGADLPVPPAKVAGLSAVASDGAVDLSWTGVATATGYNLYRLDAGGAVKLGTTTGTTSALKGLTNGYTYSFFVTAFNAAGEGSSSDTVSATPVAVVVDVPTGLQAVAADGSVALTWTKGANNTSFQVYRSVDNVNFLPLATSAVASYTDLSVTNGTSYWYQVAGIVGDRTGAATGTVQATPKGTAPAQVVGLVAKPGNSSANLTWSASSGATTYKLYRGVDEPVLVATLTAPGYVETGLVNGNTYFYFVVASNGWGEATPSASVSVTPVAPPPAPAFSLAAGTYVGSQALSLSATGTDSIQYSFDGTNWTRYASALNISSSRTVYARSFLGASVSTVASASYVINAAADLPTGLAAVAGNATVTLTWTSGANNTSFKIYRGTTVASLAQIATSTLPSYVDATPVNGTTYYYAVAGVAGAQTSALTAAVSAKPVGVAPSQVVGLVGTAGNASASLTWTASTGATSYKVYRGTVLAGTVTTNSWSETGLVNGTSYSYTVVASNTWGDATASAAVAVVPTAPAASVKVQYSTTTTAASANGITPRFRLVNTGTTAVPLSELTVRYWYTNEGGKTQSFWCDWAQIGSTNVTGSFKTVSPARTKADAYLEVGFTTGAGSLAAGATTGEIQTRFSKSDWSNYTQTNDASFDATKTAYADWNKVTVYRKGVLIWGTEP